MRVTPDHLMDILHQTISDSVRAQIPDLSARQLAILLLIATEYKLHTVRGLAAQLNISKPAISRSIDRLCELDLAARVPDERDRRSILVVPTNAGHSHVVQLKEILESSQRALPSLKIKRRKKSIPISAIFEARRDLYNYFPIQY